MGSTRQAQLSPTQSLAAENLERMQGSPRKCSRKTGWRESEVSSLRLSGREALKKGEAIDPNLAGEIMKEEPLGEWTVLGRSGINLRLKVMGAGGIVMDTD